MSRLANLWALAPSGLRDWKLWLLQALANLLLFALFVGWLLIPESRGWHVGVSLLGIVVLAAVALLVHAGTFAYLSEREEFAPADIGAAYARALRNLAAFAICAATMYLLWRSADRLDAYQSTLPAYLRSMMPALLRRHISRAAVSGVYAAVIFLVRWIICPALLLPFAAAVAHSGFRGFGRGSVVTWYALRSGWYWLAIAAAAVAGVLFTTGLIVWRPFTHDASVTSVTRESASMVIRLSVAYVIGLASWLATCSVVGEKLQAAVRAGGQTAP
jgi:hypothetical protein